MPTIYESFYKLDENEHSAYCIVGWSEIKIWLKTHNSQAGYSFNITPSQILSKVSVHMVYDFSLQK